jgi:hypothetical protein
MQTTQQKHRRHWLLLFLVTLFITNGVSAQEVRPTRTTVNADEIEKTLLEYAKKDSTALGQAELAEAIRYLLGTIKKLETENEKLRIENERARAQTTDKLNAIEGRLTLIEKENTGQRNTSSFPRIKPLRIPRYDRAYDYDPVNF